MSTVVKHSHARKRGAAHKAAKGKGNPGPSKPKSPPGPSNSSLKELGDKVKALERVVKIHDEEQEYGFPSTKAAVHSIICPDELRIGNELPVLPIAEPRPRFPLLMRGTNQLTFAGDTGALITLAPGQHSFALRISGVVPGGPGNTPVAGEYLLINLGGVSPSSNSVALSWSSDYLPSWVYGPAPGGPGNDRFIGPLPVQQQVAGWIATVPNGSPPPCSVITYTGNVWHTYNSPGGTGVFLKTLVTSKRLLVLGQVSINVPAAGTGVASWGPTTLQPFTGSVASTLNLSAISTQYGAEVQKVTDISRNPILAETMMSTGYPRLYPACNLRTLALTSVLSQQVLIEAVSLNPESLVRDDGIPSPGDFDLYKSNALQVQISELNPMDRELKGFNLRSGLIAAPKTIDFVIVDLACAGIDGSAGPSVTVNNVYDVGYSPLPIDAYIPETGWGACCGVTMLRFSVPAGVVLPLTADICVWMEALPPPMSGFPVLTGKFDPAFDRSLQETSTLPVLASYHSFKDFLKGAVSKVAKIGKMAASEAWRVGKEVAISSALAALL